MEIRYSADIVRYKTMTNAALKESFALENLFAVDQIPLVYSDVDRGVIGSAVPVSEVLVLAADKELASDYFAQRREIGVINIGDRGSVSIDGVDYPMGRYDSLYIARGAQDIEFKSADGAKPAKFYFVSYPAHATYSTQLIPQSAAIRLDLGSLETSNQRTIFQSIHPSLVTTCQLVMGFTALEAGSVWNTFPPHTHKRRSEYYMYFDMDKDSRVFHFMGEADNMRSMVMRGEQVAISPLWSMHCGVGTGAYKFVWAMGGENQQFDDMDHIDLDDLG